MHTAPLPSLRAAAVSTPPAFQRTTGALNLAFAAAGRGAAPVRLHQEGALKVRLPTVHGDEARQAIIINSLVRAYLQKNPVTDADIKAEYDRFTAQAGDKEYHVRHILLATEAEANDVIAKIKGGAKFEDLAKASKDTGSAANGGDLDWASPSSFPPVFSAAFVALGKGQVTEKPVQTPNGFHVIKVDDIRPAKLPTLEEVKPQVAEALTQKKLQAYQEELVKKAKVQ